MRPSFTVYCLGQPINSMCLGAFGFGNGNSNPNWKKQKLGSSTVHRVAVRVIVEQFRPFWDQRADLRETYKFPMEYYELERFPLPVGHVNWFVAAEYCNWLSSQEGIPIDQWSFPVAIDHRQGLQLPHEYFERTGYRPASETEWEMACRDGSHTAWHFGSDRGKLNHYGWCATNSGEVMHRAGLLKPNTLGLFDLYGNAMEWVVNGDPIDVQLEKDEICHPDVGLTSTRILRGGSYYGSCSVCPFGLSRDIYHKRGGDLLGLPFGAYDGSGASKRWDTPTHA